MNLFEVLEKSKRDTKLAMRQMGPKCLNCGSRNNSAGSGAMRASKKLGMALIFWPAAFFVGRKPKVVECFNCGARWKG